MYATLLNESNTSKVFIERSNSYNRRFSYESDTAKKTVSKLSKAMHVTGRGGR
jgi:hypothetical protein